VARHSSPRSRHALDSRRTPAHRLSATDTDTHRATDGAKVTRRSTAVTVAGSALSLAGAGAAGWVAVTQVPQLLQLALQSETPSARTIPLLAAHRAETDPQPPAAVDPAALADAARSAAVAAPAPPRATPAQPAAPAPTGEAAPPAASGADGDAQDEDTSSSSKNDEGDATSGQEDTDSNSSSGQDSDSDSDSGSASEGSSSAGGTSTSDNKSDDAASDDAKSDDAKSDASGGGTSDGGDRDSDGSTSTGTADGSGSDSSGANSVGSDARSSSPSTGAPPATPASSGPAPLPTLAKNVAMAMPSQLIDTNEWYLTLPTGKEGSPDTIQGSQLAKYHSQYYQLNGAKDGVVFTADTAGATTSGSKYPRSELREMVGSEKASWDGRKGRHTMDIVEAITQTPTAKPDVIAGQIHATTDDLMQIHLSGEKLTVKYDDGHKFVDLDPNYRLGTMFAVRIESAEGRVKVWYNGALKADLPISSSTSYFKAGVYTNSNPSKGDSSGEGQVVIKSLAVRHT
jgi:hypothetical protein